jgi:hypothetical protein
MARLSNGTHPCIDTLTVHTLAFRQTLYFERAIGAMRNNGIFQLFWAKYLADLHLL